MSDIPKNLLKIAEFQGMGSSMDPTDIKPGVSEIQINVNGFRRGQIEVRRGLRELVFETEDD